MQDSERVRYVAANYERLQGLFRVLAGVLVLVAWAVVISPLGDILASPGAADFITAGSFLLILAGGTAFLLIRNWYGRRYGRVRAAASRGFGRRYLVRMAAGLVTLAVVVAIDAYTGGLGAGFVSYLFFLVAGAGEAVQMVLFGVRYANDSCWSSAGVRYIAGQYNPKSVGRVYGFVSRSRRVFGPSTVGPHAEVRAGGVGWRVSARS